MATLIFQPANVDDASVLAKMNQQLIRDEGHRNSMNVDQLTQRMQNWLAEDYEAILFLSERDCVGYALFCCQGDTAYVRQFFVRPALRRRGVGREAIQWLVSHCFQGKSRLRLDVLIANHDALAFWHAVGFEDYCVTLEKDLK